MSNKKTIKKTVCVDFDGVLHAYRLKYHDGTFYDDPIPRAKEYLERLAQKYKVVIFSTRLNPYPFSEPEFAERTYDQLVAGLVAAFEAEQTLRQKMQDWLDKHGFVHGTHYHDMTYKKPACVAYIDDRAVPFTEWTDEVLAAVEVGGN